jgi:DNA-binding NtrC family response regulator
MKTILVVEDEDIVRDSLTEWLSDSGYDVQAAQEGDEALKLIGEKDFDLVILDLRLPGKDGLQVLREARLRKPQLKGIIITAHPSVKTVVEAMKIGAVDFLSKPINLLKLERLIQRKTGTPATQAGPILIVDDELIMRESLKDWFVDLGYAVETARDGEAALRLIGEKTYGMLIVDLKLPGKNGIEVLKEAQERSPGIKGIIITAYPSVETAVEAMKIGAINYVPKPVALSELEKLVAKNIEPMKVGIIEQPFTKSGIAAMLRVLDRAAEDSGFLARLSESPEETLADYPDLTREETEVLTDGDMGKVESWVGKLDQRRATWLWCRLGQEKW